MDMQGASDLEGLVVRLTPDAAKRAQTQTAVGFTEPLLERPPIDTSRIGVGDRLDITVWESQGAGLFNPEGGATTIMAATVDPQGKVFIPYADRQQAAGMTVSELRDRVRVALEPLTLSPQIDIRLSDPQSRLVAIQGAVAQPGVYPITQATVRLAAMIAQAGGATQPAERLEVALRRGGRIARETLSNVFDDPMLDVALRPRDEIVLTPIRERFIVLGATGVQAELTFPSRPLDLLSAIGAAQGLRDLDADPTGVFVFRFEKPAVANALLEGPPPPGFPDGGGRPIVYRLDLSEPDGFFIARRFVIQDGDAIFVTNAPLTELRKFLQLFNAFVTPVNTVNTLPVQ